MKKILFSFLFLISTLYSNQTPSVSYEKSSQLVSQLVNNPTVKNMINVQVDPYTKIVNIYQDSKEKNMLVYDYQLDTVTLNMPKEKFDLLIALLRKEHLKNVCSSPEHKMFFSFNIKTKYVYYSITGDKIGQFIVNKIMCK